MEKKRRVNRDRKGRGGITGEGEGIRGKSKLVQEKIKAYYLDLVQGRRKGVGVVLLSFFLSGISFIYGFFVRLISFCYRMKMFKSYQSSCKVISVGNITWGGTGKTPMVMAITEFLKRWGFRPVVLLRGYGKDELEMLRRRFPDIAVLACANRVRGAQEAEGRYKADVIVLDDGFQHWRLQRDVDIVLIDACCPFGSRRLIPRGILREPLSALSRADIIVLTRTNLAPENVRPIKQELRKYNVQAPVFEARIFPSFLRDLSADEDIPFSAIKNKAVALISGIAQPQVFARTLDLLGAHVSLRFDFPDHYQYQYKDLERIESLCQQNQIDTVITTEKDLPRLRPILKSERFAFKLYALGIELELEKEKERFFRFLLSAKAQEQPYSILVLSDGKPGHLNQAKAVARIIQKRKATLRGEEKVQVRIVRVRFKNRFCQLLLGFCALFSNDSCHSCLRCLRFCLTPDCGKELLNSGGDIIVSAGSTLSCVNLLLSYKDRARRITLMKPSFLSTQRFDLVIVPEHDRIQPKDNVLVTRLSPNLMDPQYLKEEAQALHKRLKTQGVRLEVEGLTVGVLIGGDTAKFSMSVELMDELIAQLKLIAGKLQAQILVTTSRRTPQAVERLLKERLGNFSGCKLLVIANEKNIPQAVGGILGLSKIVVVSGESISMVSEAVSAQKHVLVFRPEKRVKAQTRQDRFLQGLAREGLVQIIQPEALSLAVERICKVKPRVMEVNDRELIYQALGRIL